MIDLDAKFRLGLPIWLQCMQYCMFLFGTEISNIMLNCVISDVYPVFLQFIPLAGFISLFLNKSYRICLFRYKICGLGCSLEFNAVFRLTS